MNQIDEVRQKTDIVELINQYVPLKKRGRNFQALCPFHSEKVPSFNVSPELQIFKCFGCFPKGSLIQTNPSLKPIEKIKIGDKVATHKGRYQKVQWVFKRPYKGKLITVKTRKLCESVTLTEDHKVFVIKTKNCKYKHRKTRICQKNCDRFCPAKYFKKYKIKKIPAGKLSKNDFLLYPIIKKEKEIKFLDLSLYITKVLPPHGRKPRKLNYKVKINKDFLKLLGYYIAEGNNNRAYIRFSLGNHEGEFAKEIVNLIDKIFGLQTSIHYRQNPNKTGIEVTCCHSFLANIFENLCGKHANNKRIPLVFQSLPVEKQKVLLEAIFKGDGYTTKKTKKGKTGLKGLTTVSFSLAYQLRNLLLRLDYRPSFVTNPSYKKNGVNHQKTYTLLWRKDSARHYSYLYKTNNGLSYWLLPVREIQKSNFKGKVYNLMVEKDHSYVANNFAVGNCGLGGDVFKFLMEYEKMDFGEALRFLAQRTGVKLQSYRPTPQETKKNILLEINHLASEYYHYLLSQHSVGQKAREYLKKRGLNKNAITKFKLGYAPQMWNGLIRFLVGKKKYKPADLEAAGLIIKRDTQHEIRNTRYATRDTTKRITYPVSRITDYYDRFRGRLMFPLSDHRDHVVGFAGRTLTPQVERAKYINTSETLLYHKGDLLFGLNLTKNEIKKAHQAVVVEGEFDAISSWQASIKNVVAIKGSTLTPHQAQLLRRFTENIIFALDADAAGDEAARRGIEIAENYDFNIKVIKPLFGKDPDECAQHSPALWHQSVKKAVNIYDFYFGSVFKRFNAQTPEGLKKISQELLPIIYQINNKIIQNHYLKKLATKTDVNEEAIINEMERIKFAQTVKPSTPPKKAPKKIRRELIEQYLLSLCLKEGNPGPLLKKLTQIKTPALAKIVKELKKFLSTRSKFSLKQFVAKLPAELKEIISHLYLQELELSLPNEVEKMFIQLEQIEIKENLKTLAQKLTLAEKGKDEKSTKSLQKKYNQALSRLRKLLSNS